MSSRVKRSERRITLAGTKILGGCPWSVLFEKEKKKDLCELSHHEAQKHFLQERMSLTRYVVDGLKVLSSKEEVLGMNQRIL